MGYLDKAEKLMHGAKLYGRGDTWASQSIKEFNEGKISRNLLRYRLIEFIYESYEPFESKVELVNKIIGLFERGSNDKI